MDLDLILKKMNQRLKYFKNIIAFKTSDYWEDRYLSGGTSGEGSYGVKAIYKANELNKITKQYDLKTVIEFGCGDGNNLELYDYKKYIGLDVSRTAIKLCMNKYSMDSDTSFVYYEPEYFKSGGIIADLSISFEVLFHLVENNIYEKYLEDLFNSTKKYVLIFASNEDRGRNNHMVYREFTRDIPNDFRLIKKIETPKSLNMIADFYLFEKIDKF